MALVQGVNALVGSSDGVLAEGGTSDAFGDAGSSPVPSARGLFRGNGTDGTEMMVGVMVLLALLALILFRVGGFQAVIAS